jgi:hypothetical protein
LRGLKATEEKVDTNVAIDDVLEVIGRCEHGLAEVDAISLLATLAAQLNLCLLIINFVRIT